MVGHGDGPGGIPGDLEAGALLSGEGLLASDNIPDENQQTTCFSCGQDMVGLYCHACGQKNDDYRRSIWSLATEAFASIFSLENRIWRTWLTLFTKPGKVAREFSDGKRTLWTSPVRIYLAISIILVTYMSVTQTRIFSLRTDIVPRTSTSVNVSELADDAVKLSPDFGFFRRQAEIDRLNEGLDFARVTRLMAGRPLEQFHMEDLSAFDLPLDDAALKSYGVWPEDEDLAEARQEAREDLEERLEDIVGAYNDIFPSAQNSETIAKRLAEAEQAGKPLRLEDTVLIGVPEQGRAWALEDLEEIDAELKRLNLTRADLHALPIQEKRRMNIGAIELNGVKLGNEDFQLLGVNVLRNPALLNEGISTYLPRIMFLMMPFAALIGIVFIRGRGNALLYDHLVHAAYIHAVTFGVLFVILLLRHWTPVTVPAGLFLLGILIYLPMSARGMFRRGWFKTVFASYSIAAVYAFVMLIIVAILTAKSISDIVLANKAMAGL